VIPTAALVQISNPQGPVRQMLPRRRPQVFPRHIESHGLIRFRAEFGPSDYKDAIRTIESVACLDLVARSIEGHRAPSRCCCY
jgi:hypothetical protein